MRTEMAKKIVPGCVIPSLDASFCHLEFNLSHLLSGGKGRLFLADFVSHRDVTRCTIEPSHRLRSGFIRVLSKFLYSKDFSAW